MAARNPVTPPRPAWALAALGAIAGLALALVVFAPARWAAAAVARATDGRVQLADARGTVWNGSAQLRFTGGAGSTDTLALPSRLDWRTRPRWDGVMVALSSACCTPQPVHVRVRPGFGRMQLQFSDSRTQWPASLLAGLGTPWNTLQFEGELVLLSQGLSLEWVEGRLAVAGRAELRAQQMASRLTTLRPMGSYRIVVAGGATPTLQLDTLEGPLQLAGAGQWVGARLRFQGAATAAPEHEEALANLLNIIGRRQGPRSIISIG